jgi:putative endonuclease
MTPTDRRRRNEGRGRSAEAIAAWVLRLKGYRILARRYRTPAGEIDIIAQRGKTVAFVEVKLRTEAAEALEAVDPRTRSRVARAAALWVSQHPAAAALDLRFDVIVTLPGRLPRHLTGVFDSDGAAW